MLATPASTTAWTARGLWRRLTRLQQLGVAAAVVAAVVLLAAFANLARSTDYEVAFSSLRDEEAAAIVAKLKENKIPYELGPQGTIRVPSGQAQDVRLLMTGQGVLQKGVGMELFNQPQLGMTEFAEKINYQRALEGELGRTIGRLDAVDSARVHLVIPQPSLFTSQQKDTTASVVLQLKPGRRLDAGQIAGIAQLVAGSVEGLKLDNISIMDSTGARLNDQKGLNDATRQLGSRVDLQRALESRLEDEVRAMLDQVIGPSKAAVQITADLDWDQYESSSETYSPGEKAPQIRSQRQTSESQAGSAPSSATGGTPGTSSNVPTYPSQAAGAANQSQVERRDTTTNYELSKTDEKVIRAPGAIKRLSVAVALDSNAIETPEQADAISKLVATAAGLNVSRGDVVTLTTLPFSTSVSRPAGQLAIDEVRQRETIFNVARLVAMVIGPLLVVLVIWLLMRRGRRAPVATQGALAAAQVRELAQFPQERPGPRLPAQSADAEADRVRQQLQASAKADPAAVAQLVRTWMQDSRQRA